MRSTTTGMATGDLIPGATKERASFIHALNIGLNDLETRRDVSILMTPLSALDWTEMEDRMTGCRERVFFVDGRTEIA